MPQTVRVLVYESDPFARNWMALLLARDWRTKIVAEASTPGEVVTYLQKNEREIDLVLLKSKFANSTLEMHKVSTLLASMETPPLILWIGWPSPLNINGLIPPTCVAGCILKEEINHSLAWAVALAGRGYFIVTPSTLNFHDQQNKGDSRLVRVLNGKKSPYELNDHELEIARLAFLFSLERRDMMHEMEWKENKVYDQVSHIYEKLGIKDLLKDLRNGGTIPNPFFEDEPMMLEQFKAMIDLSHGKRIKGDETFAFHLVTMPAISRL